MSGDKTKSGYPSRLRIRDNSFCQEMGFSWIQRFFKCLLFSSVFHWPNVWHLTFNAARMKIRTLLPKIKIASLYQKIYFVFGLWVMVQMVRWTNKLQAKALPFIRIAWQKNLKVLVGASIFLILKTISVALL